MGNESFVVTPFHDDKKLSNRNDLLKRYYSDPVELNSPAVLELDSLEVGTYAVHAQYSGEDSFQPSVSQEIELTVTAPASPAEDGFRGGALSGTHRPGADLPGTGLPGHLAGAAAVGMLLILTGAVLNGRRQHS